MKILNTNQKHKFKVAYYITEQSAYCNFKRLGYCTVNHDLTIYSNDRCSYDNGIGRCYGLTYSTKYKAFVLITTTYYEHIYSYGRLITDKRAYEYVQKADMSAKLLKKYKKYFEKFENIPKKLDTEI